MTGRPDDDFDALLENSSLGGPVARRLRERTPVSRARAVRSITELRDRIAHLGSAPEEAAQAARELVRLLEDMGYRAQDEVSDAPPHATRPRRPAPSGSTAGTPARRPPATTPAATRAWQAPTAAVRKEQVALAEREDIALAEIELCGELIIAASTEPGERLSLARIDEVLRGGS
ncbi:hypothetical protein [Streptomyces adustus]